MDLPPVGLGTMGITDPAVVSTALDVGYRQLDTAQIYDNEAVVGAGLGAVDRHRLTVATKLWTDGLVATPSGRVRRPVSTGWDWTTWTCCTSTGHVATTTPPRRCRRSKLSARRGSHDTLASRTSTSSN